MTPDEYRYWQPAPRVRPFHYRWLLSALCRQNHRAWQITQYASLYALAVLLAVYTGHWWAALLPLGMSGILFNLKHPVLVDLPSMTLALAAAVLYQHDQLLLAVGVVLVAGMGKETAPAFAALYAWNPLLLVGLLPAGIQALRRAGPDVCPQGSPAAVALEHPIRSSIEHHRNLPLWVWVLPWGVLLAALANPSPQLWVCVAIAYGQCVIATDTVRLFVWALPVVALAAAPMLTGPWLVLALVLHIVNPFRTDGL